jgi:hypothetical protein
MTDEIFETVLENKDPGHYADILDPRNGKPIVRIEPGTSQRLFARDPDAFLARFERITILPKAPWADSVLRSATQPRGGDDAWPVTFINRAQDGKATATRIVNGAILYLQRGIPVTTLVPLMDESAGYSVVEVNMVQEHYAKSDVHDGYLRLERMVTDLTHDREGADQQRYLDLWAAKLEEIEKAEAEGR